MKPLASRLRRVVRRIICFLLALYVGALCVGCAIVNTAMFHPPHPSYGPDLPGLVTMGPPEAPVAGVWCPAPGATRAVLFSHGNAEDLRHVRDRLTLFNLLGFSALAWDYPGYGRTPGKPTEKTVYAAAETAFRHLVEERGFAPSNIVVCGFSIGGGPSCYLAEKHPDVGALLLFAPFKSAMRVATRVRIFPFDPFPNLTRIGRTRCPVVVIHGTADRVIPSWHGEAVAAAAGDRGRFIPVSGATHETVFRNIRLLTLREALETALAANAAPPACPTPAIEIFECYDQFGIDEYPGGWYNAAGEEIGWGVCTIRFNGVGGALKTTDGGPPRGFQLTDGIQTVPLRAKFWETNEVQTVNESKELGPWNHHQRRILYGHDPDNPGNLVDEAEHPVPPFSVPVVWCGA